MKFILLDETLDLARATTLPVAKICRETDLTARWYYKVLTGEIPDPSVRRVQRLHDYLVEHSPKPAEISNDGGSDAARV